MPERDLGLVITIVDGKPQKYAVSVCAPPNDTSNPLDLLGNRYFFYRLNNAKVDKNPACWVTVGGRLTRSFSENTERHLHNLTIRYGIQCIRSHSEKREFVFNEKEFGKWSQLPELEGQELRLAILGFHYEVYKERPNEPISIVDLADNISAERSQIQDWRNELMRAGFLKHTGTRKHSRLRGFADEDGYNIDSAKKKDIQSELAGFAEQAGVVDPGKHKYFKLIETQTESQGKFAFVLMPFKEEEFPQAVFDDVFRPLVREVLDINCVKVDNDKFKNFIENKIFSHIVKCELVIAELSTENPNVIFELGLALSFNRPLIPTYWKKRAKKRKRLSFDYEHFDTIFYDDLDELKSQLRESLEALKPNAGKIL